MTVNARLRLTIARPALPWVCLAAMLSGFLPAAAQKAEQTAQPETGATIDRVVAVVNRRAILASDLEDEIQLSVLDPGTSTQTKMNVQEALERLISRALIQQQIRQEDLQATQPDAQQIAARLTEIRTDLPACVRADCKSEAGWKRFLGAHDLTPQQVEDYLRNRVEILSFIELRFRQGIRITPEEIETYYNGTLLPQYPTGETPPPLQQVAARIEEILLQQRVNALFDNWLSNLRKQGQIEVLDPALETATMNPDAGGATKE